MPNFPVLSQGPNVEAFIKEPAVDPTLESQFEDGYRLTRQRFTVIPNKWNLVFEHLTAADKALLETFITDTSSYGGVSFDWQDTSGDSPVTRDVKFLGTVKFELNPLDSRIPLKRWKATMILVEANPTSS